MRPRLRQPVGEHTDYNDGFLPAGGHRPLDLAVLRLRAPTASVKRARPGPGPAGRRLLPGHAVAAAAPAALGQLRARCPACHPVARPCAAWHGHAITGNVPWRGPELLGLLEVALAEACAAATRCPSAATTSPASGSRPNTSLLAAAAASWTSCVRLGEAGSAPLLDTRSLAVQAYKMPAELAVVVIESRIQRGLVESAYNDRRRECEEATRALGLPSLREAQMADHARLTAPVAPRPPRGERQRPRRPAGHAAGPRATFVAIGRLLREAHASQRDDFEISWPEMDAPSRCATTPSAPKVVPA